MRDKSKTIDLTYLEDASAGNKAFIKEMMGIFLRQTPLFLSLLKENLENENEIEFKAVLHKFKPTVTMMGISKGADIIKEIEVKVKENEFDNIGNLLLELDSTCQNAFVDIREELRSMN